MESPFEFGTIVSGTHFVNRQEEIKRLNENFEDGVHTILISPRRWGKTSLIMNVLNCFRKRKTFKTCYIDLFRIHSDKEFYKHFAEQTIQSSATKIDDWIGNARKFLRQLKPKISIGTDSLTEFGLDFDLSDKYNSETEILNLSEKLAFDKKIKLIICIDEFQNIERFDDPLGFQQKLRSHWQHHKNVVYCLFGSKRHMLMNLFEKQSMPFYKFGEVFYLSKIETSHLTEYIQTGFKHTYKNISGKYAEKIVMLMENHPFYTQQLSHYIWRRTENQVDENIFESGLNDLLTRNLINFQNEYEKLSRTQIGFLKAIASGVEKSFTSKHIITEYELGTAPNIIKIINALENKEIIERVGKHIEFLDPAFKLWFKRLHKIS